MVDDIQSTLMCLHRTTKESNRSAVSVRRRNLSAAWRLGWDPGGPILQLGAFLMRSRGISTVSTPPAGAHAAPQPITFHVTITASTRLTG